jgi:AraC family transcriptional activator of pyochelin receptor
MGQQFSAGNPATMCAIEVSPEMTALLGYGPCGDHPAPIDPISMTFCFGGGDEVPSLALDTRPEIPVEYIEGEICRLVFLVSREAVLRIGGARLMHCERAAFHLPSELRGIAIALRDAPAPARAVATYRLAKSIELLCEVIRLFDAGALAPLAGDGVLSAADTRRVMAARKLIDERWNEKLTLDAIARACGLNRAKLTRGFRDLFDCSVAEAIAECRLSQASKLLLTTDLPVSLVGYEAGYQNNASFARAFGRHFGRTPSHYRAHGMAA